MYCKMTLTLFYGSKIFAIVGSLGGSLSRIGKGADGLRKSQ